MSGILDLLKSRRDVYFTKGVSYDDIRNAEEALETNFAQDYRDVLLEYGVISLDGHEFTGISSITRLNVIDITLNERKNNPSVLVDMYVIEVAYIDDIVIWQSSDGKIYQTMGDYQPVQISESLVGYINI